MGALAALLMAGCGTTGHARVPARSAQSSAARSATSTPSSSVAAPPPSSSAANPITTPAGPAAAALSPVLPLLRPAGPPLLLPASLPAPGGGRSYYFTVQADSHIYRIGVDAAAHPAAPNSLPSVPQADVLATLEGGAAGELGPSPAVPRPVSGGVPQAIGPGVTGTYFPQTQGLFYSLLRFRLGGWVFEVVDTTGLGRSAAQLLPYARRLLAATPPGQSPVPGVSAGMVVQALAPDNAAVWVVWTEGPWEYRVEGYNAPALPLSESLRAV